MFVFLTITIFLRNMSLITEYRVITTFICLYISIAWGVWSLPSLLLREYISEQKRKAQCAASETHKPEMAEEVDRGIWEKNLLAKRKKLFTLSFPCKSLTALYRFHKWGNIKYAANVNWALQKMYFLKMETVALTSLLYFNTICNQRL